MLGTLSADEREHAEALIAIDPGFAAVVRLWERRLGELNVMVEAVEPPPELWDKIRTDIGIGGAGSASSATAAPIEAIGLPPATGLPPAAGLPAASGLPHTTSLPDDSATPHDAGPAHEAVALPEDDFSLSSLLAGAHEAGGGSRARNRGR